MLISLTILDNASEAAELLAEHRDGRVLVVGDFDADGATSTALMLRAGETDRAREHLELVGGLQLAPADHELAAYLDCHAAEVALRLGDADLARECYPRLAPYAGRTGQAGSALNAGPVDAFLAMAAAAGGDTVLAVEQADAAVALMDHWGLAVGRVWFDGVRDRFGF